MFDTQEKIACLKCLHRSNTNNRITKDLSDSGVEYFGNTDYGTEINRYKTAYLTFHTTYIDELQWGLDVFMTLVERNAKVGDLYSLVRVVFDDEEDFDAEDLLEIVEETIDDPPVYMTDPLPEDWDDLPLEE